MKTLNRVLLTLVLATAIALIWSWLSRTGWADSVSLLGVGENYDNALQPFIKVGAAVAVMVAATQLVQRVHRFVVTRVLGRPIRRSRGSTPVRAARL